MGKYIIAIVIILGVLILLPFATIWSLNTLFPVLAIPANLDTWMATVVLSGVVGGTLGATFKK
jgi:hypothetical protein